MFNVFKTIRMPFYDADQGADVGGNETVDGDQQPGKTFTQAEVDRMMSDRWKDSELTKAELKEMTEVIKGFGYSGATPAEVKAELKAQLDQKRRQEELETLHDEASKSGTSPEILAEIKELKKKLDTIEKEKTDRQKEIDQRNQADNQWNEWVNELSSKHPTVDLDKLESNTKFIAYLKRSNPALSLTERYETFIELVGSTEKEAMAKVTANIDRSTSSGRSKGSADGGTHGLSDYQQTLAKQNGMSNKDYAELLGHVRK